MPTCLSLIINFTKILYFYKIYYQNQSYWHFCIKPQIEMFRGCCCGCLGVYANQLFFISNFRILKFRVFGFSDLAGVVVWGLGFRDQGSGVGR